MKKCVLETDWAGFFRLLSQSLAIQSFQGCVQGSNILLRLATGAEHSVVPGSGAAAAMALAEFSLQLASGLREQLIFLRGIGSLFGLENKAAALVKIDEARAGVPSPCWKVTARSNT